VGCNGLVTLWEADGLLTGRSYLDSKIWDQQKPQLNVYSVLNLCSSGQIRFQSMAFLIKVW
jgi:hypothetical protein